MGQVLHGSATTTEAIRRAIQHSQASLRALSKRYGINQKTVAKWRQRTSVADQRTGPKDPRSTVLSPEDEAVVVAFATRRADAAYDLLADQQRQPARQRQASREGEKRCVRLDRSLKILGRRACDRGRPSLQPSRLRRVQPRAVEAFQGEQNACLVDHRERNRKAAPFGLRASRGHEDAHVGRLEAGTLMHETPSDYDRVKPRTIHPGRRLLLQIVGLAVLPGHGLKTVSCWAGAGIR